MLKTTQILDHVAPLAERYDLWLCDIWGVIHNGLTAHALAHDACSRFRAAAGTVILLSNAPRPAGEIQIQLDKLGVPRSSYDAIVTSGDATRALIAAHQGEVVYHLGPERDLPLFAGLGVELGPIEAARTVVCTGLFDDMTETPADYADTFSKMCELGLDMICANPDLVVERGDRVIYCGGALAEAYLKLGGTVHYAGKPHAPIYDMAIARGAEIAGRKLARNRILAIGDGLKTDMAGAHAAGIDALFVTSGIHVANGSPLNHALVDELFVELPFRPVAAVSPLAW